MPLFVFRLPLRLQTRRKLLLDYGVFLMYSCYTVYMY
jgi:hypothetical protein